MRHYPGCYGCGTANAEGLGLAVRWTGEEARLEHRPPAYSEGGPGIVHGGYIGALVDETMALVAAEHAGSPAMTRRVELDFRAPTPIERLLHVRGWVERTGNRSIVVRVEGRPDDAERPSFEARGVFLRVPREVWLRHMQGQDRGPDQVDWSGGDPSTFLRWQMDGGLQALYDPARLRAPRRVAVHLRDVEPPDWLVAATPEEIVASPHDGDDWDARYVGTFSGWQRFIRRTDADQPLDLPEPDERLEGDAEAALDLALTLDFRRYA